ncbi:vWA domain-containing protein [Litoribacillus peritrichatus]|uniref:VWFA domain-containing protein n=1 Tax=Litoribacillus peritrichatus TaxID=718191 RepID=A0ABP7M6Q0_9GAMM
MKLLSKYKSTLLVLVFSMVALLSGCEESPDLQRVDESTKATISGRFFTENPAELSFPIKIIFAIDTSGSMDLADPQNRRLDAVLDLIDQYIAYEDVQFQIFLWNNSVEYSHRQGRQYTFTNSKADIEAVIDRFNSDANPNGGGTEFYSVLGAIEDQIQAECPDADNPNQLDQLSVCSVIFLTDGIPEDGRTTDPQLGYDPGFASRVEEIRTNALNAGIGAFYFHTVFLDGIYPEGSNEFLRATDLLTDMSDAGGGTFFQFENASSINFDVFDFSLSTEFEVRNFFVYNYMAVPGYNEHNELDILTDTDGDGLPDILEVREGTNPTLYDTDDDGLGDFFEYDLSLIGNDFDPLVDNTDTTQQCERSGLQLVFPDEDSDFLNDCEEYFFLSSVDEVDSDEDYIPDSIEMLTGSQVNVVTDNEDSDFDGILDIHEIRNHTPIDIDAEKIQEKSAYNLELYESKNVILQQGDGSSVVVQEYNFVYNNVEIMETQRVSDFSHRLLPDHTFTAGDNVICAWLAQTPKGLQAFVPVYKRACKVINFYNHNKSISFEPADFTEVQ